MSHLVRLVLFLLLGFTTQAETLERCLTNTPQEVKACVQKIVKNLTLESCAQSAASIKSHFLAENVRSFCFYDISEFPTFERCMTEAQKFISGDRHDDAIFECYRQFQHTLSGSKCIDLAKKFRYPSKSAYLKRHCEEISEEIVN